MSRRPSAPTCGPGSRRERDRGSRALLGPRERRLAGPRRSLARGRHQRPPHVARARRVRGQPRRPRGGVVSPRVASLDRAPASPALADAFRREAASAAAWPRPGEGRTAERLDRLAGVAARDLSLARLVEAHADALAI